MMLAATLFLLATQASPNPGGASRIEVRATTLEKALPEIGAKLGTPMRASSSIGRELVLVSFTSRDAAAFRDQMAKAFAAEWRQDEHGVWMFNRSPQLRDAEIKANRQERLNTIRRSLAKARKLSPPDSEFGAAEAERLVKDLKSFLKLPKPNPSGYDAAYYGKARDLDMRGPSHRIVRRILERFPIEELDSDGTPKRTVYSTRPTKMQLPMPFDILPEVRRYVQEQNQWAEAMSTAGFDENQGEMYTSLLYRKERVDKVPHTVLLVIRDQWASRQISVKAYDREGKQILDENEGVSAFDSEAAEALQEEMKTKPRRVKPELTPESKRFAEVFDDNAVRRKEKGITKQDFLQFLDLEKRDPLSYGASDITFSIARAGDQNLIARLDDAFFYLTYVAQQPELSQNGEIDLAIVKFLAVTTEENGWARMVPRDPENSRRTFYDRRELARALAILSQGGRLTVERQAELALITPDNPEQRPMARLLNMVAENRMWGSDDFLKLYGTLTPEQRKAATSDSGLPFSRLSDASRAILNKIAYHSDEWRLQYVPSEALRATFKNGNDPNQELYYGGYLREPTFSLPNGLPPTGTIKIQSDTRDKVKTGPMSRRWGAQEGEVMTPEDLAQNWFQSANPKRFPWAQDEWNQRNYDAMTIVNQQLVSIELRFDDRITSSSNLTSDVPIEGGPYTLKTLPPAFRDAFTKALKELEQQYKDQPIPNYQGYERGGGNQTPPPAP